MVTSVATAVATSVAQTRQQLSAIIEAAQHAPQIITNHNTPVAVLVSPAFFNACAPVLPPATARFFDRLQVLRAQNSPNDNNGLEASNNAVAAWRRDNAFANIEKPKTPKAAMAPRAVKK